MFWWSLIISLSAAVSGLILSAQPWAGTATGATIILVAFGWFLISLVYGLIRH
jgi:zinc transport system permease protein